MRFARNLPTSAPIIAVVPEKFGPAEAEKDHLKKPSDALALKAVSENVDPSLTTMMHMWKGLASPQPEASPKVKGVCN